jgi:hypothetical protein
VCLAAGYERSAAEDYGSPLCASLPRVVAIQRVTQGRRLETISPLSHMVASAASNMGITVTRAGEGTSMAHRRLTILLVSYESDRAQNGQDVRVMRRPAE